MKKKKMTLKQALKVIKEFGFVRVRPKYVFEQPDTNEFANFDDNENIIEFAQDLDEGRP